MLRAGWEVNETWRWSRGEQTTTRRSRRCSHAHDGVLALAAPDLAFVAERPTELPAERREADLVWEVSGPDGQRGILHLELQARVEADLGERLLEYFVRQHGLPIRTVLVLPREGERTPPLPVQLGWGRETALTFACDVVRLGELPQALVLGRPEPALWPLATLMAGATLSTVAKVAGRLARTPELAAAERRCVNRPWASRTMDDPEAWPATLSAALGRVARAWSG